MPANVLRQTRVAVGVGLTIACIVIPSLLLDEIGHQGEWLVAEAVISVEIGTLSLAAILLAQASGSFVTPPFGANRCIRRRMSLLR